MQMKRLMFIFMILGYLSISYSCNNNSEYFVISKFISSIDTCEVKKIISGKDSMTMISPIIRGTFEAPKNWYTSLVIVLDSTDKVYLYQTQIVTKQDNSNTYYDRNSGITEYSNYIGLRPEYLITFRSKDFIKFIKDNHDIFELDTTRNDSTARFITIASNQDTIKNSAFYDLQELTSMFMVMAKSKYNMIPKRK